MTLSPRLRFGISELNWTDSIFGECQLCKAEWIEIAFGEMWVGLHCETGHIFRAAYDNYEGIVWENLSPEPETAVWVKVTSKADGYRFLDPQRKAFTVRAGDVVEVYGADYGRSLVDDGLAVAVDQ